MKKSNYHWLIDAGHGGMTKQGVYTTAPAKMHVFEDGYTIYEGVVNRGIAKKLYTKLTDHGVDFSLVYDDVEDTDLLNRSRLVNSIYKKDRRAILVSIHSNAGGGHGAEVFTSPGETKSDIIAESLCKLYIKNFPEFRFRSDKSDGDHDKEARFWMLVETWCPAVLVENFFFDNRKEAEFLNSDEGQERIALNLLEWILLVENSKPI